MEVPRCRESWEFYLFLGVVDSDSTVLLLPEGYAFDLISNLPMLVAPGNDHRQLSSVVELPIQVDGGTIRWNS